MKIEKWNAKAAEMLDQLCDNGKIRYCNREDGVLLCDEKGTFLLFVPGSHVLSVNNGKNHISALSQYWDRYTSADSVLSDSDVSGWIDGMKCRQFCANGVTVYAQEKFLRQFPKNTLYYVKSETDPIICGIWENDVLHVIGIVLPIRLMYRQFVKA